VSRCLFVQLFNDNAITYTFSGAPVNDFRWDVVIKAAMPSPTAKPKCPILPVLFASLWSPGFKKMGWHF